MLAFAAGPIQDFLLGGSPQMGATVVELSEIWLHTHVAEIYSKSEDA